MAFCSARLDGSCSNKATACLVSRVSEKPIIHNPENKQINQTAMMNAIEREGSKQPLLLYLKMTAERKHDIFLGTLR